MFENSFGFDSTEKAKAHGYVRYKQSQQRSQQATPTWTRVPQPPPTSWATQTKDIY